MIPTKTVSPDPMYSPTVQTALLEDISSNNSYRDNSYNYSKSASLWFPHTVPLEDWHQISYDGLFLNVYQVIQHWESDTRIFRFLELLELKKALGATKKGFRCNNPTVLQKSKQTLRILSNLSTVISDNPVPETMKPWRIHPLPRESINSLQRSNVLKKEKERSDFCE